MTIASVCHISRLAFRQYPWETWINGPEHKVKLNAAAISITDPDSEKEPIPKGFSKSFQIQFHDIAPSKYSEEDLSHYHLLTREGAANLWRFIHFLEVDQLPWEVVVHCEAGISRSAAVATYIAQKYNLILDWDKAKYANPHVLGLLRDYDKNPNPESYEGRKG